ncbi:O-antigen polymerase [Croceicoccus sediminis]|uniref:O-antigen polymerase n=1 Tax=Croceicoccus sediminis TaxID=2571150 RepID=UPI0011832BCD|nr:O-antigen polymerase [Croceicoccus sediminis]
MYDLLLLASTLFYIAVVFIYVHRPAASVFHPASLYLLFHGFIFVLRPIAARLMDFEFVYATYQFQPSLSDKMTVILAANLGMVTFVATAMSVARQPVVFERDEFDEISRRSLRKPFIAAALILAPVGLYSIFDYWMNSATDTGTMVFDTETNIRINTTGNGYFFEMQLVLASLSVVTAWLYRFRWWSLLPFAFFVFVKAGSGGRGAFVYASFALMLLWLWENRRKWPEWRTIAMGAGVLVLFNFVVADRGKAIRSIFVADQARTYERAALKPLEHMDFANMEYFEYLVYAVPQRSGTYDYFLSNLQIFTEWIPRALWSGKPVGAPIKTINLFDYGSPLGMTTSLPGMGWYELGWIGVVIQCAVFAAIFGYAYRWLLIGKRSTFALLIYMLFLATAVIGFRDGSLLSTVKMSLFYLLIPLGLWWGIARMLKIPGAMEMRGDALRRMPDTATPERAAMTPAERRKAIASLVPASR